MLRETPLRNAEQFHDEALRMGEQIDALARFLGTSIQQIDERLALCVCGHVAMFCACQPTISDRI